MDEWLLSLEKSGISLELSRIKRLLKELGNPQKKFSSIHIAGTNGKGSISTFIASVLIKAGYKTGLYTSPHLVSLSERIKVNGTPISDEMLNFFTKKVRSIVERWDEPPTFFEAITVICFLDFAEENIDIGVIEVGLGGRLDATNTIKPILSIITNISLEHTDYLGNTVEKIAYEKSGVIKRKIPVVIGKTYKEAMDVIENMAKKKKSPTIVEGRDFYASGTPDNFDAKIRSKVYKNLSLQMIGDHQVKNASIAIAGLETIKDAFPFSDYALKTGLRNAKIHGRMDVVSKEPLIILDGAHNPDSAKVLRGCLNSYFSSYKPIFIIGILSDKDIEEFFRNLDISSSKTIITEAKIDRTCPKEALFKIAQKYTKNCLMMDDVETAIKYAKEIVKKDELICICGSLYLIGEAISIF
ncbi:TPA: bifunctional folylpolyglutamate synthase/dihydrofolate synthase [bacterium]|nr:bifunctional folylpolyglutamate synthase/dihydrofolate synthase [bacterium]